MSQPITVTYTNWKGETRTRQIIPCAVRFGSTQWHPDPQWLLEAVDPEDGQTKEFALQDCQFRKGLVIPPDLEAGIERISLEFQNTPNVTIRPFRFKKETRYGIAHPHWGAVYALPKSRLQQPTQDNTFPTLEAALDGVKSLFRYFKDPLPKEDVLEWLQTMTEDPEENQEDVQVYKELAQLLLNGEFLKAYQCWDKADTFVRDGVPERILYEMSKDQEVVEYLK